MQIANIREVLNRIEILIVQSGMTKQEFYDKAGISSASYSQWNTGTHTPSVKKLQRAADVLHVTVEYLLYGDGDGGEEETKKSPAVSGEGGMSYVDLATKRIWSPAPVSILVAQYGVPSAVLQEIAGCSLSEAEQMALGNASGTAEQLGRIADVFQVPQDDLIRGWVPLYANPRVAADIAHRMSTRFPTLADR